MNKQIEKYGAPIIYMFFWLGAHFLILGNAYPIYSIALSLAYGLGYYLAQEKKGHIGLSADSYALPAAALVIITSIVVASQFQTMPADHELWIKSISKLTAALSISFIGAHLFLLACAFIYSYIMDRAK